GIGFLSPFLVGTGEFEGTQGKLVRILQTSSQKICLAQPGERDRKTELHRSGRLHSLLYQGKCRSRQAGKETRQAQGRSHYGEEERDVGSLTDLQTPFQHWEGPLERALL